MVSIVGYEGVIRRLTSSGPVVQSIDVPAGAEDGDLLVLTGRYSAAADVPPELSAWTTVVSAAAPGSPTVFAVYKKLSGELSFDLTLSEVGLYNFRLIAFSGGNLGIAGAASASTVDSSNPSSHPFPSLSGAASGSAIAVYVCSCLLSRGDVDLSAPITAFSEIDGGSRDQLYSGYVELAAGDAYPVGLGVEHDESPGTHRSQQIIFSVQELPTPEDVFRASFEDASGRDPLATALLARDDAKKLCSHNVICYQYPPMLADLIIEVPIGSFYLVTPGRMVWIKLEHNPLFKMGRWAQVQSRRPLGIDSTLVDLGVRISDHPESFLEPT